MVFQITSVLLSALEFNKKQMENFWLEKFFDRFIGYN